MCVWCTYNCLFNTSFFSSFLPFFRSFFSPSLIPFFLRALFLPDLYSRPSHLFLHSLPPTSSVTPSFHLSFPSFSSLCLWYFPFLFASPFYPNTRGTIKRKPFFRLFPSFLFFSALLPPPLLSLHTFRLSPPPQFVTTIPFSLPPPVFLPSTPF